MPDSLLEAVEAAAQDPMERQTTSQEEAAFAGDIEYQTQAFAIEEALRSIGALPPVNSRTPKPYDEELRKLIESVSVE